MDKLVESIIKPLLEGTSNDGYGADDGEPDTGYTSVSYTHLTLPTKA